MTTEVSKESALSAVHYILESWPICCSNLRVLDRIHHSEFSAVKYTMGVRLFCSVHDWWLFLIKSASSIWRTGWTYSDEKYWNITAIFQFMGKNETACIWLSFCFLVYQTRAVFGTQFPGEIRQYVFQKPSLLTKCAPRHEVILQRHTVRTWFANSSYALSDTRAQFALVHNRHNSRKLPKVIHKLRNDAWFLVNKGKNQHKPKWIWIATSR